MRIGPLGKREKVLIGVAHTSEQTALAIKELESLSFYSLGLELSPNYRARIKTHERAPKQFYDILRVKRIGQKIHLLDNYELYNETRLLELAAKINRSSRGRGRAPTVISEHLSRLRYASPEEAKSLRAEVQEWQTALELANSHDLEYLKTRTITTAAKRDCIMLDKILKRNTDVIVLGYGHTENLQPHLPNHRYIKLYEER